MLAKAWGEPRIVSLGVEHQADELPGAIAMDDDDPIGAITWHIADHQMEIVSLNAMRPRAGVGRALLESAKIAAKAANCARIWLLTTNDNTPAQRFYEKLGWRRVRIHHGAADEARKRKPTIPTHGIGGVPIHDEYEYEWRLD